MQESLHLFHQIFSILRIMNDIGLIHIYNPVNQQLLRNDPKAAIAQDQPNPGAPSVPGVVAGG